MDDSRSDGAPPEEPTQAIVSGNGSARDQARALMNVLDQPLGLYEGAEPGEHAKPFRLSQVFRFKGTIALVSLLVAISLTAAIWILVSATYTARGEIRVRPLRPRLVYETENTGVIPFYENYKNTQVALMMSPTVLQRVLEQEEVQTTSWYRDPEKPLIGGPLPAMERLRDDLQVRPRPRSEIIDVTMTARRAADARVVTNAILDEYIKYVRESSDKTQDYIYQQLLNKSDVLRQELLDREEFVAKLHKELGTSTPEALVSQKRIHLDELQEKLADLDYEIALAEWQQQQMGKLAKTVSDGPTSSQPTTDRVRYEFDAEWRRLHMELITVQHERTLASKSKGWGPAHPKMIDLREREKFADEQLRDRESVLVKHALAGITSPQSADAVGAVATEQEGLRRKIDLLKYKKKLLIDEADKQQKVLDETLSRAALLAQKTKDIKEKEEIYRTVRTQRDEREMERKAPASIEINARAFVPSQPSHDRRLIFTAMALFFAVAIGFGAAYLRAAISPTIQEEGDLSYAIRTPFLGRLLLIGKGEAITPEEAVIQAEYVRMIRTALLQRLRGGHGNAVQITSAGPGVGKTTIAVMLAKSLAQCGKKVLLVDADLRNPKVSDHFNIDREPGLIAALTTQGKDAQAIRTSEIPLLSILPAGHPGREDLELLANGALTACLQQWRDEYDLVLLDSSPVLPVADAGILSRQVDGTIMVVRERHCRREHIMDALAFLSAAGAKLLGTIYIGADRRRGYGSSYYDYYYGVGGNTAAIQKA